jgi:hypothetical protein
MRAQFTPEEAADYREKYGESKFAAKAAAFRKQQADTDKAFALAKGLPQTSHLNVTAIGAEAPKADSAGSTSNGKPSDSSPDESEIERLLGESFDEAAATRLRSALSTTRQQAAQAKEAQLAADQRLVETLFRSARVTLAKELPGFSDPAKEQRIRQVMARLDPDAEGIKSPEAFEQLSKQAYYAAFGHEIAAETRAKLVGENRSVRNGQVTVGNKSVPKIPGTHAEFVAEIFNNIHGKNAGNPDLIAKEEARIRQRYGK